MSQARQETAWMDLARHPLMPPLAALIVGICAARLGDIPLGGWLAFTSGALLLWLIAARRQRSTIALLCLLAGWCGVGGATVQAQWRLFAGDDLGLRATIAPLPIHLFACAASAPQLHTAGDPWSVHDGPSIRLLVRVRRVRSGHDWCDASGQVVVRISGAGLQHVLRILPGDELQIWGHLSRPAPPANPGEINRAARDRADRVLCQLHVSTAECVQVVKRGARLAPWRLVEQLRHHARDLCQRYVDPAQVPLATALLLGTREQLDRQVTLAFLETGTIHILAISGLHLGMLVWIVWLMARTGWLSRRAALWTGLWLVAPYAILTGGQPPVVRAAALAICMSGGRLLSRPAQGWNLLAASAIAVLCFQPLGVFQIGVQLSFLAVATLGHCSDLGAASGRLQTLDPLDRLLARSRPLWRRQLQGWLQWLVRVWGTSLFVSLVSLPLVVHRFHVASPISVFLNPLLWAPIAVALFAGFGVLLLGDLMPPAAALCGWLCGTALEWSERGIFFSDQLSLGHCWMPAPPLWLVVVFYAGVALWSAWPRWRPPKWVSLALLMAWYACWLACLLAQQWWLRCDSHLRITFFSVGHGTCVLVELPRGETLLYDAGRLGSPYVVANSVAHEIWRRGRFGINTIVISHADADHFNAIGPLIERIRVRRVFTAPHVIEAASPLLVKLRSTLAEQRLAFKPAAEGLPLGTGTGAHIVVLHPPREELRDTDNANSVVLVLEFSGRRILLPGDLEGSGLQRLLASPPLPCDVLMAPHHGSLHSSPTLMMAWARPQVIILSSKSPPPLEWSELARAAGTRMLDTCTQHAIRCDISPHGKMLWSTWNDGRWQRR